MKPGSLGPDGQPRRRRRYKLRRREGGHIYHRRELAEYLAVRVSHGSPHGLPIFALHGLVAADLGLGLLVERLGGRDGHLAPPLRRVIARTGFDGSFPHQLERFSACITDKQSAVKEWIA